VEKSLFRMFQLGPLITHVIYCGSEASDSGHLLCAGTLCHPTATRSILSTTPPSGSLSTTAPDLPIPTPTGSLRRDAASSGLLLPTPNGQGPVRPQEFPAQLDCVKVCARCLLAVPYPTSSFQFHNAREALLDASALSYREDIAQAE